MLEEAIKEKRRKSTENGRKTSHKGRLPLPTHLEIRETVIEPDMDLTNMVLVGKEITDKLGYQPEKFFIDRTIRNKYAPKSAEGSFAIATLPETITDQRARKSDIGRQIHRSPASLPHQSQVCPK
jgi:hypothetical protein